MEVPRRSPTEGEPPAAGRAAGSPALTRPRRPAPAAAGAAVLLALAAALLLALAVAGHVRAGDAPPGRLPALAADGHAWAAMTEGEKLRYVEGFLAGQATRQAAERLGRAADPAALTRAVEELRREGRLAYPFAPTVYKTRLEDFFFYRDRRDLPLHEALAAVNAQLDGGR